jgi:hypothetical protein
MALTDGILKGDRPSLLEMDNRSGGLSFFQNFQCSSKNAPLLLLVSWLSKDMSEWKLDGQSSGNTHSLGPERHISHQDGGHPRRFK